MFLKQPYLPDEALMCWTDILFLFFLKMQAIFFLNRASPRAHYLQREVGNADSLRAIPESRTSTTEFLSFLSSQHAAASCSRLAY